MQFSHMIPYANPSYFFWLILLLLPIIISLATRGKRSAWYQSVITIFFLFISFGGQYWEQGVALILYVLWQSVLVFGYFAYRRKKNDSWPFYLAVVLAILPLAITKISPLLYTQPSLLNFLGISYLTFKSVQVVMEIRDGLIKEYQPLHYIQFLLFFPTISSGPIDRYRRFDGELKQAPEREKYFELLGKGTHALLLGFLYKFVLGYFFGGYLIPLLDQAIIMNPGWSWYVLAYMYVYSLYLFFDFAGYSLFAVGTSNLLGYDIPVNFNKPFLSWNIKEFWNRWHMSLSFWFRDYVYMRLLLLLMKKKVFKSRIITSNIGYFALFLLMGIWHGLTWYFVAYGLYHALLICLTDAWLRFKKKHTQLPSNRVTHGLAVVATFHAVCLSFLIFSGILNKVLL